MRGLILCINILFSILMVACEDNGSFGPSPASTSQLIPPPLVSHPNDGPIITDVEGNQYATIQIGSQLWMKQNLRTKKYRNGNPILYQSTYYLTDTFTTGRYGENWWYSSPISNFQIDSLKQVRTNYYGKWYNYYAVMDPRGLCPTGWHVPIKSEWDTLAEYLGNAMVAGDKLKTAGNSGALLTENWWSGSNGNNSSGFSAVPGGSSGSSFPGQFAVFYFKEDSNNPAGGAASIPYSGSYIWVSTPIDGLDPNAGASIRCLKD